MVVNISVIAYDRGDYARIEREVRAERVRVHLSSLIQGDVTRYALPALGALNFVVSRPPRGGVTETLALDAHGKSLSSAILSLEIP